MNPETPNERNWRKLAERFLYDDRIVYDDGTRQFTLEMLQEEPIMIDRQIGYHSARYLGGNEAILYLLKSPSNRIRNEITDVITQVELDWLKELKNGTLKYIENKLYISIRNEKEWYRLFENETIDTVENGIGEIESFIIGGKHMIQNEQVIRNENELRNETKNENENGLRNENENQFENENRNGNELENGNGNENELKNELIKENQTKNETKNGITDTLHYSWNTIKKIINFK